MSWQEDRENALDATGRVSRANIRKRCGTGNLLQICLNLHMSNTGSADPINDEDYQHDLTILKDALNNWYKGYDTWKQFDDAVKNLIQATILECVLQRDQRAIY